MPKRLVISLLPMVLCQYSLAGIWIGPDIVNSNWAEWSRSSGPWLFSSYAQIRGMSDEWCRRTVAVQQGKRYRLSGYCETWYNPTVGNGRARTRISASSIAATDWWNPVAGSGWPGRTFKSSEGIAGSNSTTVELTWDVIQVSQLSTTGGRFYEPRLQQVIYDPQMDITESGLRVNTDTPGGATASISLGLNSLSFADEPTAWSIDWGDGTTEANPMLNTNSVHSYSIGDGESQTWTAALTGSNQAGSGADSASITLLRQPDVSLCVDGVHVQDGDTLVVDIANNPVLDLSLLDSLGFIEQAAFIVPGRLDVSGSDLTFTGTVFDQEDVGQTYSLTAWVSNTGLGINSDAMMVNLMVTPEPSTALLLSVVGVLALVRRRGM